MVRVASAVGQRKLLGDTNAPGRMASCLKLGGSVRDYRNVQDPFIKKTGTKKQERPEAAWSSQ